MNGATTDKEIGSGDNSAATMARDLFNRTGQRTSPYIANPSRETYDTWLDYERPDGSRYRVTRSQSRWNDVWSEPAAPRITELPRA